MCGDVQQPGRSRPLEGRLRRLRSRHDDGVRKQRPDGARLPDWFPPEEQNRPQTGPSRWSRSDAGGPASIGPLAGISALEI